MSKSLLEQQTISEQECLLQGRVRLQDFDPQLQLLRFRLKQGLKQLLPLHRLVIQSLVGVLLLHPTHPVQRGSKAQNKGEGQGKNQRSGNTFSVFPHFDHGIIDSIRVENNVAHPRARNYSRRCAEKAGTGSRGKHVPASVLSLQTINPPMSRLNMPHSSTL
ncbi:MAG TPA: hypothetical protein VGA28_08700 [Desulfurivibrionaceae bacterium]